MRGMKEMMSCHMKIEGRNGMSILRTIIKWIKETKENEEL